MQHVNRSAWRRCHRGGRHFFDKVGRNWDTAWETEVTPWELHSVDPAFVEGLEVGHIGPSKELNKALVPGCGSGFDLLHLNSNGWHATGLDISQKAIEIARENVQNQSVTLQQGDFFTFSQPQPFDLIYDYLFFAAIDPPMRQKCASQFHSLLRPKTGRLMTLLFPLAPKGKSPSSDGPPFSLSLEYYQSIFEPTGLRLEFTHEPTKSIKPRRGRELVAFWSRED